MSYSFTTSLLSAQKTGSPNLIGTSLSGVGVSFLSGSNVVFTTQKVVVLSLSTNDVGIVFNPIDVTVGVNSLSTFNLSAYPLSTVNVGGSTFVIPTALNSSNFAIVKNTTRDYTVFPWLSTTATVPTSAFESTKDVVDSNRRRLRMLGYA